MQEWDHITGHELLKHLTLTKRNLQPLLLFTEWLIHNPPSNILRFLWEWNDNFGCLALSNRGWGRGFWDKIWQHSEKYVQTANLQSKHWITWILLHLQYLICRLQDVYDIQSGFDTCLENNIRLTSDLQQFCSNLKRLQDIPGWDFTSTLIWTMPVPWTHWLTKFLFGSSCNTS